MDVLKYAIELNVIDAHAETSIDALGYALLDEAGRLEDQIYADRSRAILTKWMGLTFLRAEIEALDRLLAESPAQTTLISGLFTSKIEVYLSHSRSILDILSYCIGRSFGMRDGVRSFNKLRKLGNQPEWLAEEVASGMAYDPAVSLAKNGWMLALVTDESSHGKCLRDFVAHSGAIDLIQVEQLEGGFLHALRPRGRDAFTYHIEDMVKNIYDGMNILFGNCAENIGAQGIG